LSSIYKIHLLRLGKEIGFRVMSDAEINAGGGYGRFYHPGAAQVWLSRAPNDELKSYHGDGDWFKVAYAGPRDNSNWKLWHENGPETDVSRFFGSPCNSSPGPR